MRSARKQLVANIARRRRQADTARLAPCRLVDLLLVADLQAARNPLGDEDGITHPAARLAVPGLHFLPKLDRADLELGQFLADLAAQAAPLALILATPAARKHPEPVVLAPDEEHASVLRRDEFRCLCHFRSRLAILHIVAKTQPPRCVIPSLL